MLKFLFHATDTINYLHHPLKIHVFRLRTKRPSEGTALETLHKSRTDLLIGKVILIAKVSRKAAEDCLLSLFFTPWAGQVFLSELHAGDCNNLDVENPENDLSRTCNSTLSR